MILLSQRKSQINVPLKRIGVLGDCPYLIKEWVVALLALLSIAILAAT